MGPCEVMQRCLPRNGGTNIPTLGKQDELSEVSRLCNRLKSVAVVTELHYTKVGLIKLHSQLRLFVTLDARSYLIELEVVAQPRFGFKFLPQQFNIKLRKIL